MKNVKTKKLSYTDEKIKKLLKEIIGRFEKIINEPFKLYIFGSLARKEGTPYSDIDLAFETYKLLDKKTLREIKDQIENIRTLRKIDLVYLNTASENIKKTIKEEGVLIYESGKQGSVSF